MPSEGLEMCETGVEALQAKLKLADQETEDAKEALRIERAKMTREKKQVAKTHAHKHARNMNGD